MIVQIQRFNEEKQVNFVEKFEIKDGKCTILDSLIQIKEKKDSSLTFRCGCSSGVCGSCAIRVNGVEKLACKTIIKEDDLIEPLKYSKVLKDLVVDLSYEAKVLEKSKAYLQEFRKEEVTPEDEQLIDKQSNCILCQSCYSSCPIFEVNKDFIGPYALSRVLRYLDDKKEHDKKDKIDLIQTNGIWDCTLCGNCTMVCPQDIDPRTDILNLRCKSVEQGYTDLNGMNFEMEMDFGFNPNEGHF